MIFDAFFDFMNLCFSEKANRIVEQSEKIDVLQEMIERKDESIITLTNKVESFYFFRIKFPLEGHPHNKTLSYKTSSNVMMMIT